MIYYPLVIEKKSANNYVAWCPDFPDCKAKGRSSEDVLADIDIVVNWRVKDMLVDGDELPEPSSPEDVSKRISSKSKGGFVTFLKVDHSSAVERVIFELERDLIVKLDNYCEAKRISRNEFVSRIIRKAVDD